MYIYIYIYTHTERCIRSRRPRPSLRPLPLQHLHAGELRPPLREGGVRLVVAEPSVV